MPYFKLIAFKMGEYKKDCLNNCEPTCPARVGDRCRLYSCHECGGFIEIGEPVVRVSFQATQKMESRRRYLYGRGIDREPKQVMAFITFHRNCHRLQEDRWIDEKLGLDRKVE